MRKLLVAVAATVASLGALTAAAPSRAEAAGSCKVYKLPSKTLIKQTNGAAFVLQFANGYWSVADSPGAEVSLPARLTTPRVFKFIITWPNGSGGIYSGSVDADGFVGGTTYDRWKPSSRADWSMRKIAQCVY